MNAEREVGLAAVTAAARLCELVRAQMASRSGPDALTKEDRSPVTIADFGAQAVVCAQIGEAFPDAVIVAEEDSAALREEANANQLSAVTHFVRQVVGSADEASICAWIDRGGGTPGRRFWVLDPIDGTKGFLRHDQYAIALALIEDGQVRWGALACPLLPYSGGTGVVIEAQAGAGTEMRALDGSPLGRAKASRVERPTAARLTESVESGHTNRGLSAQLREALGTSLPPLAMDSQAKYAAVARGSADIYLRAPNDRTPNYREKIWDHAAGSLVVTEAGGRVTDITGAALDWTHGRQLEQNRGIVATNGLLHDQVIETLDKLMRQ